MYTAVQAFKMLNDLKYNNPCFTRPPDAYLDEDPIGLDGSNQDSDKCDEQDRGGGNTSYLPICRHSGDRCARVKQTLDQRRCVNKQKFTFLMILWERTNGEV